ncbi:hypothetical protein BD779DRAFT_1680239 [Infundibulicybe gibba]|nr:hypothetical protein BD779DRAFT_1680239 [Infundibulicybe gibba]
MAKRRTVRTIRTAEQRAQSAKNLQCLKPQLNPPGHQPCGTIDATSEKYTPPDPLITAVRRELERQKAKVHQLMQSLRNKGKEANRAWDMRDRLRREKNQLLHASRMKQARESGQRQRIATKALSHAGNEWSVSHLKHRGVVKDSCRAMIRNLAVCNVPESHINNVIHFVGRGLGVDVMDSVDARTVGRIIQEGGIASEIQLVHEIESSKGHTISGDGTTIKNLNYEAKHITLQVPTEYGKASMPVPESSGNCTTMVPTTRFFGISSGANHRSETQLQLWKDRSHRYYNTYNRSSLGITRPANELTFAAYVLGLGSDHAEDQKKLDRLIREWKTISDRSIRGENYMKTTPVATLLPIILEESQHKLDRAGGIEAWEALPEDVKDQRDREAYERLCRRLGEEAWSKLSEGDKREAQLYVWAGCCMHKEMNSVKGVVRGMASFWANGLTGPVILFNRDNAAAAAGGPSSACDHALEHSQGGAVKLTSLAGALFHHKDNKRGQQDTFRIHFERHLGYAVRFPDTSNTRFQSHCDAAAELLVHLPLYIEFLLLIRDKKDNRSFNHLESNVFKGLQDIPTLTEMSALTLYSLAITHPYMRIVRGSGERRINALELGPLHDRVKAHCAAISANPQLLLAPDADFEKGALDGKIWERPEAFFAVQKLASSLPHLEGCLVSGFQGAIETWERFSTEFSEGSTISRLTEHEKRRAWIPATNDHNEGALGGLRQALRRAPYLSLTSYNARTLYKRNNTSNFILAVLSPADNIFIRKEARRVGSLGLEKQQRQKQAQYDQDTVDEKRRKDFERKQKADAREAALDEIDPELDVEVIKSIGGRWSATNIVSQINWHRRHDKNIPGRTVIQKMKKDDKLVQLIITVERYNQGLRTPSLEPNIQATIPSGGEVRILPKGQMSWEEVEDIDDEDMED